MMFVGRAFAAGATIGHRDDRGSVWLEAAMDIFNSWLKISQMFQHFQTNDESEFILSKRQIAGIALDDFSPAFGLLTRGHASGMVKFHTDVTAATRP